MKKTIIALGVACGILLILDIFLVIENGKQRKEIEKFDYLWDLACQSSGSYRTCKSGVEMLKGMDEKELKNLDFGVF